MFLVSEIELPQEQDAAAFADFMRDEYIPAVHTGPTRVGKVDGCQLLQGSAATTSHKFLWIVDWNGLQPEAAVDRVPDEVSSKFEGFGASRKPHIVWQEIASSRES